MTDTGMQPLKGATEVHQTAEAVLELGNQVLGLDATEESMDLLLNVVQQRSDILDELMSAPALVDSEALRSIVSQNEEVAAKMHGGFSFIQRKLRALEEAVQFSVGYTALERTEQAVAGQVVDFVG